jgi:uncharacterized protein Usg
MADRDLQARLSGWSLTTAEILYRLPDHPSLLQTYLWQDLDLHPAFPRLEKFLDFWSSNLDGALYKVRIAHSKLIAPRDFIFADGILRLH